tara:strand:+ start:182 stop:640 length:459 start_codon:yes stop_codon:yes gene_type:complete
MLREIGRQIFEDDSRPVLIFDGVCNFCNAFVNKILDQDPEGIFRFASLQSKAGQAILVYSGKDRFDHSSMVVAFKDVSYTKSSAPLMIAKMLPRKTGASVAMKVPKFLRDGVYSVVAANRHRIMGVSDTCRFGDEEEFEDRFIQDESYTFKT